MSKGRTKEEIVRVARTAALRRCPERQCTGDATDDGGKVCALMLLAELYGIDVSVSETGLPYAAIGARAGLSEEQTNEVIDLNDVGPVGHWRRDPLTFPQIADVIDGWFRAGGAPAAADKRATEPAKIPQASKQKDAWRPQRF